MDEIGFCYSLLALVVSFDYWFERRVLSRVPRRETKIGHWVYQLASVAVPGGICWRLAWLMEARAARYCWITLAVYYSALAGVAAVLLLVLGARPPQSSGETLLLAEDDNPYRRLS